MKTDETVASTLRSMAAILVVTKRSDGMYSVAIAEGARSSGDHQKKTER
jgi:hypothetical protein